MSNQRTASSHRTPPLHVPRILIVLTRVETSQLWTRQSIQIRSDVLRQRLNRLGDIPIP